MVGRAGRGLRRPAGGRIVGFAPLVLLALPLCAADLKTVSRAVEQEAERLRAERQALAQPIDLFCPFYSVRGQRSTDLFLLNTTADPLQVDLSALAGDGSSLPLGRYLIEGSQHLFLSMRQLLPADGTGPEQGSVRASLLGDADSLAAWAVLRGGRQAFEIPFVTPADIGSQTLLSFWDATLAGRGEPSEVEFQLLNSTPEPVSFSLELGSGRRPLRTMGGTLPPGARQQLEVPHSLRMRGWARLTHDGDPGALLGVGLVRGSDYLMALELVTPAGARKGLHFEAIRLPRELERGSTLPETVVSLLNTGEKTQVATLELLDQDSGAVLWERSIHLDPWEVRSESIRRGQGEGTMIVSGEARLRVRSDEPTLLVRGTSTLAAGELVDLAFFAAADAHTGGTYPLPDPQRYAVSTWVVNLGTEASTVVAQLFWAGGTYSVGPVVVAAGGSHRFEIADLLARSTPDLLGRRPDPLHPQGVLKWIVQRGSHELIGRTEVRRRDGSDSVGFNCFGCCWQIPSGLIVPSEVSFLPGELPPFEAAVQFNTCSGLLGPFGTSYDSATVPYPFTWDGSVIGASGGGDEDIRFEGIEEEIPFGICPPRQKGIFGIGRAKTCQKLHNPNNYKANQTCPPQTDSCQECL
ncbi:MAG: hypothetical protein ACRENB_14045, partial [Gemmatimonadales bacterium]